MAVLIAASGLLQAGESTPAETLIVHGHIYTANPAAPWAQGMSISNGRITAVGTTDEILKRKSPGSRVIDLHSKTAMPGIIDGHVHTLFGSFALHGLNLWSLEKSVLPDSSAEFIAALRAYAAAHPTDKIVFVRSVFSTSAPTMPTHDLLDRAISDRPVVVHEVGEHALWLNAPALALAGITAKPVADADEEKGVVRDANGNPSGVLLEAAMQLAERAVMKTLTREEKLAILGAGVKYLNGFGITSVVNATGDLSEIELYGALRDRHALTVRTRTAFGAVAVPHKLTPQFLRDLDAARTRYHDDWVSANLVKFFADGGSGPIPPLVYEPAAYQHLVQELDQRGYQLMTHALRADSVHMILDAYANVEHVNGARDRRLRIEHADLIDAGDIPRFAQTSVLASMQPSFCCSSQSRGSVIEDRWNTLLRSNAKLAFSSDWPCTWPPDPFVAMQETVTRLGWTGASYGAGQGARAITDQVKNPTERISIAQAVNAYTRDAAYAAFMDDRVGSLEVGKLADLVVLSQDIFSVAGDQIGRTKAEMTMVGGQIVYGHAP
jgi:predicted amidohydrolase YtcJ